MSTFKNLVSSKMLTGNEKCHLLGSRNPDGCWAMAGSKLYEDHILCVSFEAAVDAFPKLIIDAFMNKYNRKPTAIEFAELTSHILENMKFALK
ncbi:MAG: hypothetical protein R6U66_08075 [Bacteroidales bacterium]